MARGVKDFKRDDAPEVRDVDSYERIRLLSSQFDRYEEYWRPDTERAIRNARMYWHVNFGQYPTYVVERLRNEGRRPMTYPIIPDKLETLVGSFLANDFDMKLEPSNGKLDTLSLNIQDVMIDDKRKMDWETSEIACLLDSHIMCGGERMVIRGATVDDPFGRIAWEHIDPVHTFPDPGFKSRYMRDLRNYFEYRMMTATEMMEHPLFSKKSEHLKELYKREQRDGIDYGQHQGAVPLYHNAEEKWLDYHRVITFHWIEEERQDYEYDMVNRTWFPDTGFKMGSEEDRAVKMQYKEMMGLTPNDIVYLPRTKRTKKIQTICPTVDRELFLQSGKDIIQTDNCNLYLNGIFYKGQWQGIVDRLYDIQVAFNKGKMNLQDIQARSARGAFILDRALTGGDPALEQEIEQNWNNPAARLWVDEGSTGRLPGGGVIPLPSANSTPDMYQEPQQMLDMADRFSKVPAAQDARSEGSKESGVLFRHKLEVGMIGQKYLMKSWERHKKAKIEAWLLQAKITYAGVPMTITKPGTKESFTLNEPAEQIVTGKRIILNDISLLPQMSVSLVPSQNGMNIRHVLRSQYAEALEFLTKDPRYGLLAVTLTGLILETQEMPDEHKEEIRAATKLLKMQEALAAAKNVYGLKVEVKQMMDAIQQMAMGPGAGALSPEDMAEQQANEVGLELDEEQLRSGTPMQEIA